MPAASTERTTAVVIGAGMPGLAVASELSRYGVDAIVVDGMYVPAPLQPLNTGILQRCDAADAACLQERSEILRHLRIYAASHALDVRSTTRAVRLDRMDEAAVGTQWAVHTANGVLLADHVIVTRCGQSQLRRMLAELGIAIGQNLVAAMRAIGMYLVGVGELATPTPKEVLRQAKVVGQAISAKVYPDSVHGALTGTFAAVPVSA
ncbi:FAD-dependent monooxygenase [Arthrobacter sp. FW306-2-2C-D06B]|uniref:FAD-dependent monooxygenase n=1 Tax=Arthrobacter sp. FW306-2-2C-D06B TaxID=2879618 RepID=UPI001F02D81B|nr:FAD-dependent monooxygenase [Arthrobacter sp. FW306-2-2C-D06B]UKA60765.1 FAD-dependent monooxygenase [Arthrobacter sp. FW306-2-2C-D06B]